MFSKVRKTRSDCTVDTYERSMIFQLAPFETQTEERPARTKSLRHSVKKPGRISADKAVLDKNNSKYSQIIPTPWKILTAHAYDWIIRSTHGLPVIK